MPYRKGKAIHISNNVNVLSTVINTFIKTIYKKGAFGLPKAPVSYNNKYLLSRYQSGFLPSRKVFIVWIPA